MSKQAKKKPQNEDSAGCLGALVAIPVVAFVGYWVVSTWNEVERFVSTTEVTHTPPTPADLASRKCRTAVENKYSAHRGFDIVRLTSQRITMIEREDGTWSGQIAVPFKTVDAQTGRRNRVFWINVACEIDGDLPAKITEKETAGYPG